MSIPRTILLALVAVGFLCSLAHGESGKESLTEADRQLFAWFDQLDLEDLTHARLVRLRTGLAWTLSSNDKEELHQDEPRAYLLWEKDGKCRAVLADLTVATFGKKGLDPKDDTYVGWRPVSMEDEVKYMLTLFSKKESDGSLADGYFSEFNQMGFHGQTLALARYCAGNGREDLAAQLLRATEQHLRKAKSGTLREEAEEEVGGALSWRATLACADASQNRHALASLMRNIVKHCPHFSRVAEIAKTAAELEQMAIEDDAHAKVSDEELAHLSPDEQARELVFRLRDDYENDDVNWPRPWPFEPTKGNGAMKKLEALGLPAIPALLEALKDERPTRSVVPGRCIGSARSKLTLSVAQLAVMLVTKITGFDFFSLFTNDDDYLTERISYQGGNEEDRRAMRVLVEDWWKTTQEKGDIEWFRARVVAGAHGAHICLRVIAGKHPEMLPELAVNALPSMTHPKMRLEMLQLLQNVKTPEVDDLLMKELTAGPTRCNRVFAAYLLRERHQPEALGAMLAEFDATPKSALKTVSGVSFAFLGVGWEMDEADSPENLIGFLLSSDSILGVKAISAALQECNRYGRAHILFECSYRLAKPGNAVFEPASKEVKAAIEEMLISELQDEEVLESKDYSEPGTPAGFESEFSGLLGYLSHNGTDNRRVAEIAAMTLSNCWPDRYNFKIDAAPATRAEQLAAIRAKAAATNR